MSLIEVLTSMTSRLSETHRNRHRHRHTDTDTHTHRSYSTDTITQTTTPWEKHTHNHKNTQVPSLISFIPLETLVNTVGVIRECRSNPSRETILVSRIHIYSIYIRTVGPWMNKTHNSLWCVKTGRKLRVPGFVFCKRSNER
jgi:hypothetical protein